VEKQIDKEVKTEPLTHSRVLALYSFAGSKYSDQDRIRVAMGFLVHGNVHRAARETGLPTNTIYTWVGQPWWEELLTELRVQNEPAFQAGFAENLQLALDAAKDRLVNGDVKLVKGKDGYEERRVPPSLRDVGIVSGIFFDKYRLSRGDPTAITANVGASAKELRKIAKEEIQSARMKDVVSEQ